MEIYILVKNRQKKSCRIADSNINALELLAIEKALFKLKKEIQPSILVRSDSTTAVSYINNMGGHGSNKCNFIARKICSQKIAIFRSDGHT